jgi:hypothetical protein
LKKLSSAEYTQKMVKGQFRLPSHFDRDISSIWRMALVAGATIASADVVIDQLKNGKAP